MTSSSIIQQNLPTQIEPFLYSPDEEQESLLSEIKNLYPKFIFSNSMKEIDKMISEIKHGITFNNTSMQALEEELKNHCGRLKELELRESALQTELRAIEPDHKKIEQCKDMLHNANVKVRLALSVRPRMVLTACRLVNSCEVSRKFLNSNGSNVRERVKEEIEMRKRGIPGYKGLVSSDKVRREWIYAALQEVKGLFPMQTETIENNRTEIDEFKKNALDQSWQLERFRIIEVRRYQLSAEIKQNEECIAELSEEICSCQEAQGDIEIELDELDKALKLFEKLKEKVSKRLS